MNGIVANGVNGGYEVKSYSISITPLYVSQTIDLFPLAQFTSALFIPSEIDIARGKSTIVGKCEWNYFSHIDAQPFVFWAEVDQTTPTPGGGNIKYKLAGANIEIDVYRGYCQLYVPPLPIMSPDSSTTLITTTISGQYILVPDINDQS